jgi:hypothetical protein
MAFSRLVRQRLYINCISLDAFVAEAIIGASGIERN